MFDTEPAIVASGDQLVVRAAGVRGEFRPPGDKSISHRILMLGSLTDARVTVRDLSSCRDVTATRALLTSLGVSVEDVSPTEVTITGVGLDGLGGAPVELDCGSSGTTMRLAAGLLAGQRRAFTLTGSAQLRRRPMERVALPLRALGATIETTDGHAPLMGIGGRLRGSHIRLERASAQLVSAVLLAGLQAEGCTRVDFPAPVRDHTERMLGWLGAPIEAGPLWAAVGRPTGLVAPSASYDVPGDISSAAFLLAAAVICPGSTVTALDVGLNPGRIGLLDALKRMGADLKVSAARTSADEPRGVVVAKSSSLTAIELPPADVGRMIDELPLLAVLASQSSGTTRVTGAGELRVKETDRIAATVAGLAAMGARISALPDGFEVQGPTQLRGAQVNAHGDHRIAMALAVAGLSASGPTVVDGASGIPDSYPEFVDQLSRLATVPAPC